MKRCCQCGAEKPLGEFYFESGRRHGKGGYRPDSNRTFSRIRGTMGLATVSAVSQESLYPSGYNGGTLVEEPTLSGGGRLLEAKDVSAPKRICSVDGCDNLERRKTTLCAKHYARRSRRGMLDDPPYQKPVKERFFNNTLQTEGCWLWTASKGSNGYGVGFAVNGKLERAHRISWLIHYGDIPDGMYVLHKCDNRMCVRPDHLFLGTHLDNISDMVSKKRHKWGAKNSMAKLSVNDVVLIKRRLKNGHLVHAIALDFGVSPSCVDHILKQRTWTHVD